MKSHAAAVQYVRKVAGTTVPQPPTNRRSTKQSPPSPHATGHLLDALVTTAPPKNREEEAVKARRAPRSATREVKVTVFFLGGTISMSGTTSAVARLGGEELLASVPD